MGTQLRAIRVLATEVDKQATVCGNAAGTGCGVQHLNKGSCRLVQGDVPK